MIRSIGESPLVKMVEVDGERQETVKIKSTTKEKIDANNDPTNTPKVTFVTLLFVNSPTPPPPEINSMTSLTRVKLPSPVLDQEKWTIIFR